MGSISFTQEMGNLLKKIRMDNKVRSKDLALHLEKSPAYISKLEKGDIKTISDILLTEIIDYISNGKQSLEEFIKRLSDETASPEQLEKSEWFVNYDLIKRKIPVEQDLINYLVKKIETNDISNEKLVQYINQNEDLDKEFEEEYIIDIENTERNRWFTYFTGEVNDYYIVLKYDKEDLDDLLEGRSENSSYTFIYAVIYHLLKFEYKKANSQNINSEIKDELREETRQILRSFKFYTLADKSKLARQAKSKDEFENLLSDFDRENRALVNQLVSAIRSLSDYDVKYTNTKLNGIVNNFRSELSFALSYMALPIREIDTSNYSIKKEFLDEIGQLINKYKDLSLEETVERY